MASRPNQLPQRVPRGRWQHETQPPQDAQLASHPTASTPESSNPDFVLNNQQTPASSSASQAREQPTSATPTPAQEPEVPTCWICQQDATDDTPETSIWRRPCPCSLTAHDDCLLEWITSQEAPKPGEMATTKQIVCPVCQAPIKIERPRDLLVTLADFIQKCAKTLVVPSALSALIGCFYSGFLVYGMNTMYIVFGQAEARRLLMPSAQELRARAILEDSGFWKAIFKFIKLSDPFLPTLPGLKLFLGLPMIAPALVLSRTKLADQIFAILPISYFVFHPTRRLDLTAWPPSPALTLAVLPYIRTTYNEVYKHTFSELEKQWDTAVQRKPREGETAEQIAAEQQGQGDQAGFFDIEVELVEEGEVMPEDIEQADNAADVAGRDQEPAERGPVAQALREQLQLNRNAADNEAPGQQPNEHLDVDEVQEVADLLREGQRDIDALRDQLQQVQNAANEAQAAAGGARRRAGRNNNGWEIRQNVSTAQVASTVMGALFFPAISSIMGDLLKAALPGKWVTKQPRQWGVKVSGGLLREKWGRTIIGGCLFVVLKDAVTLYCKWKKARDFGKKRVLDYVGERRQG